MSTHIIWNLQHNMTHLCNLHSALPLFITLTLLTIAENSSLFRSPLTVFSDISQFADYRDLPGFGAGFLELDLTQFILSCAVQSFTVPLSSLLYTHPHLHLSPPPHSPHAFLLLSLHHSPSLGFFASLLALS